MSDETARVANIQSRLKDITEGPWAYLSCGDKDNSWAVGTWAYGDEHMVPAGEEVADNDTERFVAAGEPEGWHDEAVIIDNVCENADDMANFADAVFIANAPEDIRFLLARLATAEAENERLHAQVVDIGNDWQRDAVALATAEKRADTLQRVFDAVNKDTAFSMAETQIGETGTEYVLCFGLSYGDAEELKDALLQAALATPSEESPT